MTFLESIAIYTTSQKAVAFGFLACGLTLVILAGLLHLVFAVETPLWQGVKSGAIVFGLFFCAGGFGYLQFCISTHQKLETEFSEDPVALIEAEQQRMSKVVSDYSIYQLVFAAVVLISLAAIIWAKEFWGGFAFPAAFVFLAVLLIEAQSKYSIDAHFGFVSEYQHQTQ